MGTISLPDVAACLQGTVDARVTDEYVRPWRLPTADMALHHPGLVFMASLPSGVRLRFRTSSRALRLSVDHVRVEGFEFPSGPRYDVTVDGELVTTVDASGSSVDVDVGGLPGDDAVVELWLPMAPGVRLRALEIDSGATFEAVPDERPRWITYGSSITHCVEAHGPARTWPALASRLLDWHLTSFGFAGMCHLDPLVARTIAAMPADRITLKLGINVHNGATLRERTFAPMVHGFLATLRDAKPDVPITVISPILSPEREDTGRSVGVEPDGTERVLFGELTLRAMRDILESVVRVRQERGDKQLDYLDGRELFGENDLDHLPDGLHPDGEGYERMGRRFAERFSAHQHQRQQ
jgi:hypothetical protein